MFNSTDLNHLLLIYYSKLVCHGQMQWGWQSPMAHPCANLKYAALLCGPLLSMCYHICKVNISNKIYLLHNTTLHNTKSSVVFLYMTGDWLLRLILNEDWNPGKDTLLPCYYNNHLPIKNSYLPLASTQIKHFFVKAGKGSRGVEYLFLLKRCSPWKNRESQYRYRHMWLSSYVLRMAMHMQPLRSHLCSSGSSAGLKHEPY